jgi:Tol biopolymer transport system component
MRNKRFLKFLVLLSVSASLCFFVNGCGNNDDDDDDDVVKGHPGILLLMSTTYSSEVPFYYDPETGELTQLFNLWSSAPSWDKNHKKIALSDRYDIYTIDPVNDLVATSATNLDSTIMENYPAFLLGDKFIVYSVDVGFSFHAICRLNTATSVVDTLYVSSSREINLKTSHSSRYIAYMHSSVSTSVYCIDTSGNTVTLPATSVTSFEWANKEDKIIYAHTGRIRVIDVASATYEDVISSSAIAYKFARFNPADTKIAYSADFGVYSELYLSDPDGSNTRTILAFTASDSVKIAGFGFSEQGDKIAVAELVGFPGYYRITLVDVATSERTILIDRCYSFKKLEWF